MHLLKTGLNADKFATFWMFPKKVSSLIRLANDPYTLQKPLNASTPTRFRKKNMKACETVKHNAELFLSSKLLPRKQRNSSKDYL